MNGLMTRLFGEIDELPYSAGVQIIDKVVGEWCASTEVWKIRQGLLEWLKEAAGNDYLRSAARETSTHYVWPLYTSVSGHSVVINEFKDPGQMSGGYATTLHNHRYPFSSLMLCGGYTQLRYSVETNGLGRVRALCEVGADNVAQGNVTAVADDVFHRLMNIERHTMTLVVKGPAVKEDSISVDVRTLIASRHLPVEARLMELMDSLAVAEYVGPREGNLDG
jgi:hypothetical protein